MLNFQWNQWVNEKNPQLSLKLTPDYYFKEPMKSKWEFYNMSITFQTNYATVVWKN